MKYNEGAQLDPSQMRGGRRGGGGKIALGGGAGLIVVVLALLFGINPNDIIGTGTAEPEQTSGATPFAQCTRGSDISRDRDCRFVAYTMDGVEATEVPGIGRVCTLDAVQTKFGTPRTVAGESIATDTQKCALRPLVRSDYYPIEFSDAQWEELETAFPTGVCDYTRAGVDQSDAIGWLTYQEANGRVVYGGTPLGPSPRSQPVQR